MAIIWGHEIDSEDIEFMSEDERQKFLWHLEETVRAIKSHWGIWS